MKFHIKFSLSVWANVFFVYLLFLGILWYVFFSAKEVGGLAYIVLLIVFLSFTFSIIYGYRYRIYGYVLDEDTLTVENSWGRYPDVLLEEISEVRLIRSPFSRSVRLIGNWGFYGFYGEFKQIGGPHFTAYVTDTRNCVMLHMKGGGIIVISPYERELFLDELAKLCPDLTIRKTIGALQSPSSANRQ